LSLLSLFPGAERRRIREELRRFPALTTSSIEGEVVVATGVVGALGAPLIARAVAIVVDPTHAHVALPMLPQTAFENPRALAVRMEHRGYEDPATPYETVVAIGSRISVAARLARESAAAAIYRDAPTELILIGSADEPVVIVDAD
jgi:hypothetical protein